MTRNSKNDSRASRPAVGAFHHCMSTLHKTRTTQSDRLLDVLSEYDEFVVVMHDNPDPDAIASGWGVQVLIEERLHKAARVVGRGAIVRAENRHLVQLLQPPIELIDEMEIPTRSATIPRWTGRSYLGLPNARSRSWWPRLRTPHCLGHILANSCSPCRTRSFTARPRFAICLEHPARRLSPKWPIC